MQIMFDIYSGVMRGMHGRQEGDKAVLTLCG